MKTPTKISLTVIYELAIFYGMFFVLDKILSCTDWWLIPTSVLVAFAWVFLANAGIAVAVGEDGL